MMESAAASPSDGVHPQLGEGGVRDLRGGGLGFGSRESGRDSDGLSTPRSELEVKSPDGRTKLFVGQIPKTWTSAMVLELFKDYHAQECFIIKDKASGGHAGCAFVTFLNEFYASHAIEDFHNKVRLFPVKVPLQVRVANAPTPRSRNSSSISSATSSPTGDYTNNNNNHHEGFLSRPIGTASATSKIFDPNIHEMSKIFVVSLVNLSEEDFISTFSQFGTVLHVLRLPGNNTCYIVTFADHSSAVAAVNFPAPIKCPFSQSSMFVSWAKKFVKTRRHELSPSSAVLSSGAMTSSTSQHAMASFPESSQGHQQQQQQQRFQQQQFQQYNEVASPFFGSSEEYHLQPLQPQPFQLSPPGQAGQTMGQAELFMQAPLSGFFVVQSQQPQPVAMLVSSGQMAFTQAPIYQSVPSVMFTMPAADAQMSTSPFLPFSARPNVQFNGNSINEMAPFDANSNVQFNGNNGIEHLTSSSKTNDMKFTTKLGGT